MNIMKKVTLFYMVGCPYCVSARKAIEELKREDARCAGVEIDWIDERKESALAEQYDYYYVPSIYLGKTKLYEASPSQNDRQIKESVRQALHAAADA